MNPEKLRLALSVTALIFNVVVCVLIIANGFLYWRVIRGLLKRIEALESVRGVYIVQKSPDARQGDSEARRAIVVSITCPMCGMTSHNPDDVKNGYCGNCHAYTGKARTL
jgi:hypothetical protein